MYEAVQKCKQCGAGLTLDDMRKPNCPYCGTIYPHHSQAAQHAEMAGQVMNQMMAQQAQIQNQWRGAFGVGPMPPGAPPGMPGNPYGPGMPGSPSPYGQGMPGSPYGNPQLMAQAQFAQVGQLSRRITMMVTLSIVGVFLLTGLIIVLTVLL
jgi:hypothetical protein